MNFFSRDTVELKSVHRVVFMDFFFYGCCMWNTSMHTCLWKVTHLSFFLKDMFLELIIPSRSILYGYFIPILRNNRYK